MTVPTRGVKSAGGTSFSTGVIKASEVNADLDTLYNALNGGLAADNVAAAAGIAFTQLDDASSTDTNHASTAEPGSSASHTLPTTGAGEIQQLRYAIERLALGNDAKRVDGTGSVEAFWGDLPARGVSLLRNGTFSVHTAGTPAAPDGWTLVGTPTTCDVTAIDPTQGTGTSLNIVCQASAAEGISQTAAKLKADGLYLAIALVNVNAGTVRLKTAGADVTSSFRDVDIARTAAGFAALKAVFQVDSTPSNVTISVVGSTDATIDDFDIAGVWLFELNAERGVRQETIVAEAIVTADQIMGAGGALTAVTNATVSLTIPAPGYYIEVSVQTGAANAGVGIGAYVATVYENGANALGSSEVVQDSNIAGFAHLKFDYCNWSPTPGTTYTYALYARTVAISHTINSGSIETRIRAVAKPYGS